MFRLPWCLGGDHGLAVVAEAVDHLRRDPPVSFYFHSHLGGIILKLLVTFYFQSMMFNKRMILKVLLGFSCGRIASRLCNTFTASDSQAVRLDTHWPFSLEKFKLRSSLFPPSTLFLFFSVEHLVFG